MPRLLVLDVVADPAVGGDGVHLVGVGRLPGRLGAYLHRHQVQLQQGRDLIGADLGLVVRNRALVAGDGLAAAADVVAVVAGRDAANAGPLGQGGPPELPTATPL